MSMASSPGPQKPDAGSADETICNANKDDGMTEERLATARETARACGSESFNVSEAFSRNIGWVTREEQAALAHKRVAIAGMGGVGGSHLLTLARLGIGGFNLSDYDSYEAANFNRQAGARVSTIGRPKVQVMSEMARDINPTLTLREFDQGVTPENVHEFLDGADVYLDGVDFFAVEARRMLFAACTERGIPAVTAAPLGMGVALLSFLPGKMSFEEYFRLEGQPRDEQLLRFLVGLAPAHLHAGYLVDPSTVDLENEKGPSTPMAADLCAGLAATEVLKILLGRGKVLAAPWGLHFDAFRGKFRKTWRPWGNRNWVQRLMLAVARRQFGGR
jgi:molybdopterin/thiamine biosynthesis adenylyltransferase